MIEEIYDAKLAKQDAELRSMQFEYNALQAEINPHFLFNTLETIGSSAKLANAHETSEAICTLAELLRVSLGGAGKPGTR